MAGKEIDADAVVIGAGPAGLAVAACLQRARVSHILLERKETVAPSWRRHYDRLHLHTSRAFSALPFHPMPRSFPPYPSRDQVVEYLQEYARAAGVEPRLGVEARQIRRTTDCWQVETCDGILSARAVVVATGVNGEPKVPAWAGLETFPGPVIHSSEYTTGAGFSGADVLIVGFGNSGGEIALDLVEHGARPTISVRSPVNIIPRDIFGLSVLAIAIPLSRLPPRLADLLIWPVLKSYYPSFRRLGLTKSARGPFQQIERTGRIPLLDIGTVREIRRGRIDIVSDIAAISGRQVSFVENEARTFDAVVLATGYSLCVPSGDIGTPANDGTGEESGIYFCGFYVSPTGMLREIGIEARRIARRVREQVLPSALPETRQDGPRKRSRIGGGDGLEPASGGRFP